VVPVWAFFFLLGNLDAAGRPFLIGLIGTLMTVTGAAIVGQLWL
jgi:hypothetical protein